MTLPDETSRPSRARTWISAARPRTLPAAVAGDRGDGARRPRPPLRCRSRRPLPGVFLLVQIGTNFANDYYDFVHGADSAGRVGPTRAVASGRVAPRTMRRAMAAVFAGAFVVGLGLTHWGGPWMLAVGAASILSGLAYTGGPWPLGYTGSGICLCSSSSAWWPWASPIL